ncbi:2-oxoglutarate ferredoxin oxidoreductase subunit delta [Anaerobranca californiensis DSM 14826]|jgi:2-oxoglutarate ferredoxin oxidoreductase subunit delta|uniref:2-oxoglutarate ferredoxin oxidoreductase subunit delta n=1 Tax=Anaerobranca californiensis DSM 14826 TaxID=1120989 RepID=A0A1M6R6Y4_9FIRM|nr:4Fe-4S binding protein [Anaerobranca californiensis]SHK28196.1 2-oxoglutarate ferredoxin oxidoreductase subunit delta [Anaerobranca californiensis DSM 14826]
MSKKYTAVTQQGAKANFHNFPQLCKGCGLCIEKCPVKIITWSKVLGVYGTPTVETIDQDKCIACGICQSVCPDCAIAIEKHPKK